MQIRPYRPEDSPAVTRMFRRIFLEDAPVDPRTAAFIDRLFARALFEGPWHRDDLPSLVQVTDDGRVTGFLGVVALPMVFDGAPIHAALTFAFMVEPGARPGGLPLLRRFLRGPQDVTLGESAVEPVTRMYEALGFRSFASRGFNWLRVFRPSQAVLSRLTRSATPSRRLAALIARPGASLLDRAAAHVPDLTPDVALAGRAWSRPLATSELLELIEEAARGRRFRPHYDERGLQWLLDVRASAAHRGRFVQRAVEDERSEVIGWYLGHLQRDGISEIVQIGALEGGHDLVLGCAISDARRSGSAMVQGRMEGGLLKPALQNHCLFRPAPWLITHARDPAILDALEADDVFLSPLEVSLPW